MAGLVVIGLLIVIGYALWRRSGPPDRGRAGLRRDLYAFDQMAMSGESVTLKDLRGQAVVVNFWASYCVPCQEAPLLERVWNDFRERGVIFLGINTEDPLKRRWITWSSMRDLSNAGSGRAHGKRLSHHRHSGDVHDQHAGRIVRHFLSEPAARLRNAIERALEG